MASPGQTKPRRQKSNSGPLPTQRRFVRSTRQVPTRQSQRAVGPIVIRRLRCIGSNSALAAMEIWSWRTTNTASLFPACNVACAKTSPAISFTLRRSVWSPPQSRKCPSRRSQVSGEGCPTEAGTATGASANLLPGRWQIDVPIPQANKLHGSRPQQIGLSRVYQQGPVRWR